MLQFQLVIVVDLSNYNLGEETPFKAIFLRKEDNCYWVKSTITGENYEIYDFQILETLPIDKISNLLDMSKYGH